MKNIFLRISEVTKVTGFSRSQIYNLMRKGLFPRQVQIGPKSVAWLDSEISEWIKERIHQSRNNNTPG